MATVIKCEVDGVGTLELMGGLSFGYNCSANVFNPANNKKITFGPVQVSTFSFSIIAPDKDVVKKLIEWVVSHQVKGKATFKVSEEEDASKTRDLVLEQVCLESYNESVTEYGPQISLSIIGQKVTVDGVPIDQTAQR